MRKQVYVLFIVAFFALSTLSPVSVLASKESKVQNEIIYHILIDRFNNGKQSHSEQVDIADPLTYNGGDIKGISMKLDTIVEHGFTSISLSPVMKNTSKGYHGYWIEDFYEVEEEFGTLDELKKLVKEAHEKDLKVMIELVTNYVAKTSPIVQDENKQAWFKENDITPIEATKWLDEVLVFDQKNEEVQEYLIDVAKYWVDELNIDGVTLHAADQAEPVFLDRLTKELKAHKANFHIIANTLQGNNEMDPLCEIEQIDAIANGSLFTAMNDVFSKADEPVSHLHEIWKEQTCDRSLLFLDNMNTARFSNNFAEEGRNAITVWQMALSYLYFTPGTPMIYQGSEVPMYGPGFPENQNFVDFISADPDLKKVFERISAAREQFPSLVHGDFEQIAVNEGLSLFRRSLDEETVYIAINNDSESRVATISDHDENVQLRGLFHDDTIRINESGEFLIGMERESAEVFIIQPNQGFNWLFIGFVLSVLIGFILIITYLSRKQKAREQ